LKGHIEFGERFLDLAHRLHNPDGLDQGEHMCSDSLWSAGSQARGVPPIAQDTIGARSAAESPK
jgi:hypothetical protein